MPRRSASSRRSSCSEPIEYLSGRISPLGDAAAIPPVVLPAAAHFEIAKGAIADDAFDARDRRIPRQTQIRVEGARQSREAKTFGAPRCLPSRRPPIASLDEARRRAERRGD